MFKNTGTYTVAIFYAKCSQVKVCVCVFKFSETTGPTEAKFHVVPPWNRGKDGFKYFRSFVVIHFCQPPDGVGAFSRDFTTNLARSAGLLAGL